MKRHISRPGGIYGARLLVLLVLVALAEPRCRNAQQPDLTVTGVDPASGPANTAVPVSIGLKPLDAWISIDYAHPAGSEAAVEPAVRLGGRPLLDVRIAGDDLIKGVVPPELGPGVYDLEVVDALGRSATYPRAYRALEPSIVAAGGPHPDAGAADSAPSAAGGGPGTDGGPLNEDGGSKPADGGTIAPDAGFAEQLQDLNVEQPCRAPGPNLATCVTLPTSTTAHFGGVPGQLYQVTLRARGVVELQEYTGASPDQTCISSGTPPANSFNVYRLRVLSPLHDYYLNNGTLNFFCVPLDCTFTVTVAGGSDIVIDVTTGSDNLGFYNKGLAGFPIVIPGVPTKPSPFNGQFIRLEVLSVE